ncbi:MAG: hypothetical protein K6B44_04465 [Lachnospiraceae bacterium]|nr:hypothetical protein [Lachnospiraceae bacterium]
MRDAIPAGNRNAERNFHDTLSVTKGGMFMSLFGLHGDFVGTNIKSIQAAYQKSVYEDPVISDADKADPARVEELIAQKTSAYEQLKLARETAIITSGLAGPSTGPQLQGYSTMSVLHYMAKHPGVSLVDAMDPAKDIEAKREATMEVVNACIRTTKITEVTKGGSTAKIMEEGSGDDMVPIVSGAVKVLSTLNIRDTALQLMGADPNTTTPEQAKAIFSDPQYQSTVRPAMASIASFYHEANTALSSFGMGLDQHAKGLKGSIAQAVYDGMGPLERKQWELTQRNLSYLDHDTALYKLSINGSNEIDDPQHYKGILDSEKIAKAALMAPLVHDRLAETGTLAAIDSDPVKSAKRFASIDAEAIVFGNDQPSKNDLAYGSFTKNMLAQGIPAEMKSEIAEQFYFNDAAPLSMTSSIREELENARTPQQMESVISALKAAAPTVMSDDAAKGMIGMARNTGNCLNVSFVDPNYQPAADGKPAAGEGKIGTISLIKPEIYADLKASLEECLSRIDASRDPAMRSIDVRYMTERARQNADPLTSGALNAGKDALDVLSGITMDRVQAMEDLYARMKADQSRFHKDSDEYKAMYQAVTKIHERAAKGYDQKDPAAQAEMSELFTEAFQAAVKYSDREVEGKTKKTQRGLDRKNFTLSVLTTTAQHREGESTWYLPKDYDKRRLIAEDPITVSDPGIGDLMKEESRYNRTFREYRIGKDAAAAPLPKKPTEEISRKPIPRKPTSLDRLVELERMEHKTKNPFQDKEIEDIMAAHDKRMAERRAQEAANAPAASAAGRKQR